MLDFVFRRVPDLFREFEFVFECREKGVTAFDLALDEGQIQVRTAGQRFLVYLRAAADKDVVGKFFRIQFVQRVEYKNFRLYFLAQL